jgi:hypothetical protein
VREDDVGLRSDSEGRGDGERAPDIFHIIMKQCYVPVKLWHIRGESCCCYTYRRADVRDCGPSREHGALVQQQALKVQA